MNFSLHINGKIINEKNLAQFAENCEEWEKDIYSFLTDWASKKGSITVQTSGSTGDPKPIELLKSDMIASAELTCEHFNLLKGDSALLCLPTKYIAGKMMLVRAMVQGLELISVQPSSCPTIENYDSIDFAAMTPMQVRKVLQNNKKGLNSIKQLIIGGAPVDHILEKELQSIPTACYSTFGMTETITHIAVKKLNGSDKSEYYTALKNITFETGKESNLIIKAPYLSDLTFTTSDIVLLSGSHLFKWKGRTNNTINSGGVKLHPEQIENKIQPVLPEHRFFISSQPNSLLGEELILIVESTSPLLDLLTQLKSVLTNYEVPKQVFYTSTFVETETGKVNRIKTQELAHA